MFKSFIAILTVVAAVTASATTLTEVSQIAAQTVLSTGVQTAGLSFKVGDSATYKLTIASFITGTMSMTVKDVQANAVTLTQTIAVMGQNQACEEVINPGTGAVTSMTCNGQAQNPDQNQSDIEVVDSKEETVTVPAGTFDTLYVKALNKKDNSNSEEWVNLKQIPVMGLVQMNAPTQLGTMNLQLASFVKN